MLTQGQHIQGGVQGGQSYISSLVAVPCGPDFKRCERVSQSQAAAEAWNHLPGLQLLQRSAATREGVGSPTVEAPGLKGSWLEAKA